MSGQDVDAVRYSSTVGCQGDSMPRPVQHVKPIGIRAAFHQRSLPTQRSIGGNTVGTDRRPPTNSCRGHFQPPATSDGVVVGDNNGNDNLKQHCLSHAVQPRTGSHIDSDKVEQVNRGASSRSQRTTQLLPTTVHLPGPNPVGQCGGIVEGWVVDTDHLGVVQRVLQRGRHSQGQ